MKIAIQTIFKNEDRFLYFALKPWIGVADEVLVYDDNSTDQSAAVIQSLDCPKINYRKVQLASGDDLTKARNDMLKNTKSDFFILVDGDEVWTTAEITRFLDFLASQAQDVYAVSLHTRNAIGDVFHYLSDDSGHYSILGRTGHLNTRAYRKLPNFSWQGHYPYEFYGDSTGKSVNDMTDHLAFFEGYYWHYTNLRRSSVVRKSLGRMPVAPELGVKAREDELPEVFFQPRPKFIGDPLTKRTKVYFFQASLLTPFKKIKRKLPKI